MVRLVALADMKVLLDAYSNKIEWRYIQMLHDEQTLEGLKFANKLLSLHIYEGGSGSKFVFSDVVVSFRMW